MFDFKGGRDLMHPTGIRCISDYVVLLRGYLVASWTEEAVEMCE